MQEAGHAPAAHGWLQTALQTKRGTAELYSQLQQYVQKPAFLQKLVAARSQSQVVVASGETSMSIHQDVAPTCPDQRHPHDDVMQASFWEEPVNDVAVPSPDEV